jgi:hypothetical protein
MIELGLDGEIPAERIKAPEPVRAHCGHPVRCVSLLMGCGGHPVAFGPLPRRSRLSRPRIRRVAGSGPRHRRQRSPRLSHWRTPSPAGGSTRGPLVLGGYPRRRLATATTRWRSHAWPDPDRPECPEPRWLGRPPVTSPHARPFQFLGTGTPPAVVVPLAAHQLSASQMSGSQWRVVRPLQI